ncbi:response regulator [Aeromonas hydrophila]|uniref:response regulator n=1 Tax=Aeromonas hydrophila TaxID=644 RepID=UPI003987934A
MRILIAEDNDDKATALCCFIKDNFEHVLIEHAKALNTAFHKIKNHSYDLILLDMTMPSFENFDNSDIDVTLKTLAGKDLINKLAYRKILTPVIIVTAFELFGRNDNIEHINSIASELKTIHPDIVKGCVIFDVQSNNWKAALLKEINRVRYD